MTGKYLATCLVFVVIASTLLAEENPAERAQGKSFANAPAARPGIAAIPFPPAMPSSTTETVPRVAGRATRGLLSPAELRSLVRAAGIIFSGQVIAVRREAGDASAATVVNFHVEDAFRGAFPGESLTIHEWAGLWPRGETYRVGERVLLFLYRPSKLGFTSPVHSAVGRFEMDMRDTILLNPWQTEFFSSPIEWRRGARVSYAEFALCIRRAMAGAGKTIRGGER